MKKLTEQEFKEQYAKLSVNEKNKIKDFHKERLKISLFAHLEEDIKTAGECLKWIEEMNNKKEEEKMEDTERKVLVEIKTKTTGQWNDLCEKLQLSLDNEDVFPHVECYSTYEKGEMYPNIMNDKCYEDCKQNKIPIALNYDFYNDQEEITYIDAWFTDNDNEEGTVIAKVDNSGKVEYTKGYEYCANQDIVKEAIGNVLQNIEKEYAKTIVTIKSYLEDDGKQKYYVIQGYDKENTEWGCCNIIAYVYLDGTVEWDGDNQAIYEDIPLIKNSIEDKIKEITTKDKKYYLRKRTERFNECYANIKTDWINEFLTKENTLTILEERAEQLFHDTASVEEAVGYYIETYGDNALEQWLDNIGNEKESSEHRKAITKILEELYSTYIRIWYSWGDEEEPVYVSKEEARAKMVELALEETRIYTTENGCGAELIICNDSIKDCRIEYDDGTTCFYKIVNG